MEINVASSCDTILNVDDFANSLDAEFAAKVIKALDIAQQDADFTANLIVELIKSLRAEFGGDSGWEKLYVKQIKKALK